MKRVWLAPLAFIYNIVITIRHKMFDWGWLRSQKYDIPIICVGNLTVGGTGKTPVTEMLIRHLHENWNIAVLSRGYKRRTKGYHEAEVNKSFLEVGDEPKQIKLKFPDVVVAVCEKRTEGIAEIRRRHPKVDLIILDDGFQHRYVEPWVNIILIDYTRPIYRDHLLPWGSLRDKKTQLHRANYVILTKCPQDLKPIDKRIVRKSLKLFPYQKLFFTHTESEDIIPMFPDNAIKQTLNKEDNVIAMSGIGNPTAFRKGLSQKYNVIDALEFPDHHPYRKRDLKAMQNALNDTPEGTVIVATEKDSVKLRGSRMIPQQIRERLYYLPIQVVFNEDSMWSFINKLEHDIKTNPRDRLLHS